MVAKNDPKTVRLPKIYALKPNNKKGTWRPDKYTPDDLLKKANEYFESLSKKENLIDRWTLGKIARPKTLSWLCIYLWVSKDYISEKLKDSMFSEVIKRIRVIVENNIEEWILLNIYNPTSWIFSLKNHFDWVDKKDFSIWWPEGWPLTIKRQD